MSELEQRILAAGADPDVIAQWLDGLDGRRRIEETQGLGPESQRRLWTLCRGRAVTFDDLVPPDRPTGATVRHHGRNTLPAFQRFEKRFRWPDDGRRDVLWGYNEGLTRPLIGPGYFLVRHTPGDPRGEVVVDYRDIPPQRPAGWPALVPNTVLRQRFVYGDMQDFLRQLTTHVSIGRAWRSERETPNFFVLCRED